MPKAYPTELRDRVLALSDDGGQTTPVAGRLMVSRAWVRRVKRHRDGPPPRPAGVSRPKLDAAARERLDGWVAETPDATLEELRVRVADELGVRVSIGCLFNTLRRMRLTHKKSRSPPSSGGGPTWRRPGTHSSPSS